MHNRLNQQLYTNIILVTGKYVFRKGISTEDAACRLTDSVFKSTNQKMHDGKIFCDLAEAFNCMNHEIFLAKIHFYGI
jgi:cell division protein YceG involved in septum cleavage